MPFHKKKTKDVDAFNSKTSTNGQVNDNGNPLLDPIEKRLRVIKDPKISS